jgi:predicted GIY-YIG superfamily endonuclease
MSTGDPNQHYVYLYRTKAGKPLYVGYGASVVRSAAHLSKQAHNEKLSAALRQHPDHTLEIGGPFGDEHSARSVETALISAYRHESTLCNVNKGHHTWRFRPLGVPNEFVQRVDQPALAGDDLCTMARRARGLIIVNIHDRDLGDGRAGDLLADIPDDAQIAERMDRWWQLRGHAIRTWRDTSADSPGLLVGVSGRGSLRMVIASIEIDRRGWREAIDAGERGGLLRIPHDAANLRRLDRYQIRGRRIDVAAGIDFGRFRHETFIVLDATGATIKGGRKG